MALYAEAPGPGSRAITSWWTDTGLEDLAGNRIGQAFDIDVFERVTEHITTGTTVSLPFVVR